MASVQFLRRMKVKRVVEFGCGLGYFSNMLNKLSGAEVIGVDISETAIKKAKQSYPHIDFRVGEVKDVDIYDVDAFIFAEITWYILPQLKEIFEKLKTHHKSSYFINNLVFYKEGQKYGTEYFTSLDEFIEFVPFKLLGSTEAKVYDNHSIETSSLFEIG